MELKCFLHHQFIMMIDEKSTKRKTYYSRTNERLFCKTNNADFTDPMTAGIFVNIVAWAKLSKKYRYYTILENFKIRWRIEY